MFGAVHPSGSDVHRTIPILLSTAPPEFRFNKYFKEILWVFLTRPHRCIQRKKRKALCFQGLKDWLHITFSKAIYNIKHILQFPFAIGTVYLATMVMCPSPSNRGHVQYYEFCAKIVKLLCTQSLLLHQLLQWIRCQHFVSVSMEAVSTCTIHTHTYLVQ